MVAYLFAEVAKNFYLIHHPERVDRIRHPFPTRRPLRGNRSRPPALARAMEEAWTGSAAPPGRQLMEPLAGTLRRHPVRLQPRPRRRLSCRGPKPPEFHRLEGSNFFRGLALIDLAEAMLKRAFGGSSGGPRECGRAGRLLPGARGHSATPIADDVETIPAPRVLIGASTVSDPEFVECFRAEDGAAYA